MTNSPVKHPKGFLFKLDAHYRLYCSLAVCIAAFFIFKDDSVPAHLLTSWIAFSFCTTLLDWVIILFAHPLEMRKIAGLEDSSRTMIFLLVLLASLVSLAAIYILLKSTKNQGEDAVTSSVFLAMGAVITSWLMVHTVFTMRYAHLYYDAVNKNHALNTGKGLRFPDEPEPDYLDFVYFSFVVGMTFQVSDVEISSRRIRRLCLMHGVISFAFNTAIVALSINIISGLVSR